MSFFQHGQDPDLDSELGCNLIISAKDPIMQQGKAGPGRDINVTQVGRGLRLMQDCVVAVHCMRVWHKKGGLFARLVTY
jgi:hypothetical protein